MKGVSITVQTPSKSVFGHVPLKPLVHSHRLLSNFNDVNSDATFNEETVQLCVGVNWMDAE